MLSIFKQMAGQKVDNISAVEAQELLKDKNTVFVDVREPYEYANGHIAKASNIPVGQIKERMNQINKEKQVVVVCASGMRSQRAAGILASEGYNVKNMTGGMSSWRGKVS
ncbi:MAG: rhodanese-like domain-containing protein [Vallitaleaceae bacterium]|jgi:phage shock protein E|nr:rhodanese-like domain-containing protein [Vallitaleaceae bacterium]